MPPAVEQMENVLNPDMRIARGWMTVEIVDNQKDIVPIEEIEPSLNTWMSRGGFISDAHSNRIIGKALTWRKETHPVLKKEGVIIDYQIFKDYSIDDEVWKEICDGIRTGLSFGGRSLDQSKFDGRSAARKLGGIETYEVASVRRPANPAALNTAVNYEAKSDESSDAKNDVSKITVREMSEQERDDMATLDFRAQHIYMQLRSAGQTHKRAMELARDAEAARSSTYWRNSATIADASKADLAWNDLSEVEREDVRHIARRTTGEVRGGALEWTRQQYLTFRSHGFPHTAALRRVEELQDFVRNKAADNVTQFLNDAFERNPNAPATWFTEQLVQYFHMDRSDANSLVARFFRGKLEAKSTGANPAEILWLMGEAHRAGKRKPEAWAWVRERLGAVSDSVLEHAWQAVADEDAFMGKANQGILGKVYKSEPGCADMVTPSVQPEAKTMSNPNDNTKKDEPGAPSQLVTLEAVMAAITALSEKLDAHISTSTAPPATMGKAEPAPGEPPKKNPKEDEEDEEKKKADLKKEIKEDILKSLDITKSTTPRPVNVAGARTSATSELDSDDIALKVARGEKKFSPGELDRLHEEQHDAATAKFLRGG